MLRTRRASGERTGSYSDDADDFEVETPGDAALYDLPAGIIMPGVKSNRALAHPAVESPPESGAGGAGAAPAGGAPSASASAAGGRPGKTLKAPPAPLRSQGARAAPRLPVGGGSGSRTGPLVAGPSKPASQFKGTPARVPRYSLPVRADKPVRTSKVSGRHVLLPSESQLAPSPFTEEDEEEEEEEEDEEAEHAERAAPAARREAHARLPPRAPKRKGPVYHTFERMPPSARARTPLPRLTSYAISTSINISALLGFLRREHWIRPRLYDGCAYAMYFKPLLPGFGRATVRSSREPQSGSPGRESRHERELRQHEDSGYVGSYFDQPEEQQNIDDHGFIQGGEGEGGGDAIEAPSVPQEAAELATDTGGDVLAEAPPVLSVEPEAPSEGPRPSEEHDPTLADRVGAQDMLHAQGHESHQGDGEAPPPPRKTPRVNRASHNHDTSVNENAPHEIREALDMAELVILPYGVLVMYNFTRAEEESIVEDVLASGCVRGANRVYDSEVFHFCYDPDVPAPRIYNDFFTFRAPNHLLKLSLAHAIAQSTKLSEFEESMHHTLELTSHIPKELAQTGELHVSRRGALRMSGQLFKLRVDVNLTSDVLDTPDLFWSEASLQALYDAIRQYLEIDERAETLNERLAVANDLLEIIHEHLNNNAMSKITWIVIVLIVVACFVAVGEIMARVIVHARNVAKRGVTM